MEKDLELIVFQRFVESLTDPSYKIVNQDRWKTSILVRKFDIVIYFESYPLAVIEVKTKISSNKNRLAIGFDQVRSALSITNARFGVVTDNEIYYFYDKSSKEDFKIASYNEIIVFINQRVVPEFNQDDFQGIGDIFRNTAKTFLSDNLGLKELLEKNSFVRKVIFDTSSNVFCFDHKNFSKSLFEDRIFSQLVGEFHDTKICRYCSFDAIFSTIDYLTFRLNGIVGMNDKTEINYVDTYIENVEKPISSLHHNTVSAINRRYITSCSQIKNKDDLTLWRLYGEDAKGSCLIFKVNHDKVTDKVLLRKVKYAGMNGNLPELDFIKQVVKLVEQKYGFNFMFKKLGVWKHFFKPYEYSMEEEVRLLIIDSENTPSRTGWVKTYSHSILNPYIDFELNNPDFPLELIEIILGPKCPEQEINKMQLEEMIRRKKSYINLDISKKTDISKLKVELSEINHYR